MKSEAIQIQHKIKIIENIKKLSTPLSEYSFANIYLFRKIHEYKIITDKKLFIKGMTRKGHKFLMPLFEITVSEIDYLENIMRENSICLYPVSEEYSSLFDKHRFEISFDEDESDYIYLIDKIGSYSGKKLHKKKNLLNQFLKRYNHKVVRLDPDRTDDAMLILNQWQQHMDTSENKTDYHPCKEGLSLMQDLNLCGIIYYAEEQPAGFILGEELSEEVFALHFVKGLSIFKGIYQFMYNNFTSYMPEKYCCFNFEQDLGIDSLRKAKQSYRPETMLNKFMIKLKGTA